LRSRVCNLILDSDLQFIQKFKLVLRNLKHFNNRGMMNIDV